MLRLSCLVSVFLVCCLPLFAAPACISGNSLASYEALGATGCNVGPLNVNAFSFSVVSSGGGATPVADTAISVTTVFGAGLFGLKFGSGGFNVSGAGFVNYLIGYTWDPTGSIRGMGDILDPGTVDILTNGCVDFAFTGASCSGTPVSVHVFEGATTQLTDSVSFTPTSILGIRNNIGLNAQGATASFNAIENDVFVPEPASVVLMGLGLIGLSILVRKTA